MKRKEFCIPAWFGLFGFLGLLGFLPGHNGYHPYLFFAFFGFFGWFFWAVLLKERPDERMVESQKRACLILLSYYVILSFALLYLMDKGLSTNLILALGALAYGLGFILCPALILFIDRSDA